MLLVRSRHPLGIRAAVDVFDLEPPRAASPLLQTSALLTPHIAYKTNEALLKRTRIALENIRRFFEGDDTNRIA